MRDSFDLVVTGGTVVNSWGSAPGTIAVRDGKIAAVLDPAVETPDATRIVDAHGCLVIPGGVDPHCHIGQRLGDYQAFGDYESDTIAALWGGTTTVVGFAIPTDGTSSVDEVRSCIERAKAARCDTALHGCVADWDGASAESIGQIVAAGVRTVKLFTTYRDLVLVDEDVIVRTIREISKHDGMVYVHAESNAIVEDAQRGSECAGALDASHHAGTRPELAERIAVASVLAIAEQVDAPVYFVHLSTPEAVDLVQAARARGVRAYGETCPHYISLDSGVYAGQSPERFVCCPPIRSRRTVDALVRRAVAGHVDTLGSDHCCYTSQQKSQRADDVTKMPNGLPGVETRLPVSFTELVQRRGMSVERFVSMFATNPARLNGLETKGAIRPGGDADLVVFDPNERRVMHTADLHMETDYSPYEGGEYVGWPRVVLSRGTVVLDSDGFHDPGPVGVHLGASPLPRHVVV